MERYEQTSLWHKTLAVQPSPDVEFSNRDRLCAAYKSFRQRASVLGGEIAIDLPEFTVHDLTHLDALWEFADIVAGPDFPLTPAEAFVLGGAFLIHDLGMGLAAYPDGISTLKASTLWADTIASLLRKKTGSRPLPEDIEGAPPELRNEAMRQVLRELHAKQAERLALVSWRDRTEGATEYHLIDDPDLRMTYGTIIGKIAQSHWWPVEQLEEKLPKPIGAPGGFNKAWTVDPVKLACILRAADACHIDERRAPGFLATLRKLQGTSADHWAFQEKLYQPRLEADRLTYSSKEGFSIDEVAAWWTCYDTLKMIDKELRSVDALLADTGRTRLTARGVAQTEDPVRLATRIATDGWIPIDANIKVGDVAKLVSNLGGEKLYGRNELAPLRELIQNACDAVRARRLMEDHDIRWGNVCVRCGEDNDGRWIEVEDSGIGMSRKVLTGPFLDFGSSLWGTHLMHQELPGLEAKGFASTGQFGIGFFSVFMWGDKVQIASRRAEAARDDTLVLEFRNGLGSRPVLRNASATERLMDGGTRVRVWFREASIYDKLLVDEHDERQWTLESRCAWLCPALDVDLFVCTPSRILAVGASDWVSMPGKDLIERLIGPNEKNKRKPNYSRFLTCAAAALRPIQNAFGDVIGRCCITVNGYMIADRDFNFCNGTVTVGGFRSSDLTGVAGILIGTPFTAARNVAIPEARGEQLVRWASEQASVAGKGIKDGEWLSNIAERIRSFGGETGSLVVAEGTSGRINTRDIARLYAHFDELILVQDASLSLARRHLPDLVLNPNVLAVGTGIPSTLQPLDGRWVEWPSPDVNQAVPEDWEFLVRTLEGSIIETMADAWNVRLVDVLAVSSKPRDDRRILREVWMVGEKSYSQSVAVIRNPRIHSIPKRTSRRTKPRK